MRATNAATSIALIVLAAGSAAYAYLVDRAKVSDDARRTDVFPSFRADQVRHVELVHEGETTVLDRPAPVAGAGGDAPVWRLVTPLHEEADQAAVDVLLREVEMARRVRAVSDRDATGLDAPRVRGTIAMGPITYRFALGGDALSPEGAAYLRVEGQGTFVVERSLKVQLLRGVDAYRERQLVPYGILEAQRLMVRAPGGEGAVLVKVGAEFRLDGQHGLRASRSAVERVFGALADARADVFIGEAAARSAIGGGAWTVGVAGPDEGAGLVTVLVGGACPNADSELADDVVALRIAPTPAAACVPKSVAEGLAVAPATLIDDSPFASRADEIDEVRFERVEPGANADGGDGGDGARVAIDLARRGGGWHERAPEDREIAAPDSDSVNALIDALAGARATAIAPPGEPFVARGRVSVARSGGAPEVVEIGAPDASGVLVRRADDRAVLRLPLEAARRFQPHPIALSAPGVWRAPVEPASVVAVDDLCARSPARIEVEDGAWKLRGAPVDNLAASDLVEGLARAKASAWIAETDDGSFGFDKDGSCAVTLAVAAAGEARRRVGLVFGASGEGGVYARSTEGPGVFVVPASLRALVARPPVDRGAFRIETGALARLVVVRGAARVTLGRRDGALERIEGAGTGASAGASASAGAGASASADTDRGAPTERLESALEGLRAEWALHTGPPGAEEGFDRPTLEIDATPMVDGSAAGTRVIAVGAPTRDGTTDGYFARVGGLDATFLVRRAAVHAILDAL
ncbi:MAG TPA: DUF4340 domain-containing protein [Polyangiaceae bacterium]|nr:DUF4340 domain-containing protein [Polyangiaceae bacterium]